MSRFRYTIKDLENSDEWLISRIALDRASSCTNINSPLYRRLMHIYDKYKDLANDKINKKR